MPFSTRAQIDKLYETFEKLTKLYSRIEKINPEDPIIRLDMVCMSLDIQAIQERIGYFELLLESESASEDTIRPRPSKRQLR